MVVISRSLAQVLGCAGGSVLKNPHANAGDVDSIPGWGRK